MANGYYSASEQTRKAKEGWEKKLTEKPGDFVSPWTPLVNAALEKLRNRRDFSYDAAGDALYRQYKDRYLRSGRQAMTDTAAHAAAKTGGYGNSYGTSAAAAAYGDSMAALSDKIPELYRLALSRYDAEGEKLREDYDLAAAREQGEKDAYRQLLSDWENEVARLEKTYNDARDFDFNLAKELSDTEKWQQELEEKKRQFDTRYGGKTAGGSGGKTGKETESGFDAVSESLRDQKVAGASREKLIAAINDAYRKGRISRGEMLTLMGWYGTAVSGGEGSRETAGTAKRHRNYVRD